MQQDDTRSGKSDEVDAVAETRVLDACERVRRGLAAGIRPHLPDLVDDSATPANQSLLRQLLTVLWEFQRREGGTVEVAGYRAMFPNNAELVEDAYEQFRLRQDETADRSQETTAPASGGPSGGQLAPGTRFGRFEIIEELGRGGFGAVYRARDTQLDRDVALKLPRTGTLVDDADIQRFLREGRAAAQLRHPHVVAVHDAGEISGTYFIASDYISGKTLRETMQIGQPMQPRDAARLVAELSDALHYAHQMGVIHRDVKPGNVMIGDDGRSYVMDFGLARREQGDVLLTQIGSRMGTPAYMSPEQAKGDSHLADARSDLWSLGVMLYELLTGARPFVGNISQIMAGVLHDEPAPLRRRGKAIPRDLETICLKCLAKNPDNRYASCQELSDELQRWLRGEAILARRMPTSERVTRWVRRHPVATTLLGTALVVAIGLAVYQQTRPGFLDVRITPADAIVDIDGDRVRLEEGRLISQLAPGRHTVEAVADGFRSHQEQVILARGRNNMLVKSIELKSIFGHVQVESRPSGALVEILDPRGPVVASGASPFYSPKIPGGTYRIRVSKEFFEPSEITADVPDGDRVNVLSPVTLTSNMEGAKSLEHLVQLRAFMSQPLRERLTFKNMSLRAIARELGQRFNISIDLDYSALDDHGVSADEEISITCGKTTVGLALQQLTKQLDLCFMPSDLEQKTRHFVITTAVEMETRQNLVVYPVRDLMADSSGSSWDLRDQIQSSIAPGTWDDVGGPASIDFRQSALIVSQTWDVHLKILELLEELRRVQLLHEGTSEGLAEDHSLNQLKRIKATLNTKLSEAWSYQDATLSDVASDLAAEYHIDLRFDQNIAVDSPVQFRGQRETLASSLNDLMASLQLRFAPVGHSNERLQIRVSSADVEPEAFLVVYPVKDIVAAGLMLQDAAPLLRDIEEIDAETWESIGGRGSLRYAADQFALIVSQTWDVHLRIVDYLETRRTTSATTTTAAEVVQRTPAERHTAYLRLKDAFDEFQRNPRQAAAHEAMRQQLVQFAREEHGTPEGLAIREFAPALRWPIDELLRQVTAEQAVIVRGGVGGPQLPKQIVAIFGEGRLRHWGPITAATYSPNGELIATAGSDFCIHLWSAETFALRQTLLAHSSAITDLAFSPDGKTLASSGRDHRAVIWDVQNGDQLVEYTEHVSVVHAVSFSPDGNLVVTAGNDLVLHVWDPTDGTTQAVLKGHSAAVGTVAFAPDGTLISGSDDGTVRVWDVEQQRTLRTIHAGFKVWDLALSSNGARLAYGGEGANVRIQNLTNEENLDTATRTDPFGGGNLMPLSNVQDITFGREDEVVYVASQSGLSPLDAQTGRGLPRSTAQSSMSSAVAFTPRRNQLAVARPLHGLAVYDIDAQHRLHQVFGGERFARQAPTKHVGSIIRAEFSADGNTLWTLASGSTLESFDLKTRESEFHRVGRSLQNQSAKAIAFDRYGAQLILPDGWNSQMVLTRLDDTNDSQSVGKRRPQGPSTSHDFFVLASAVSNNSKHLAFSTGMPNADYRQGAPAGKTTLWNLLTRSVEQTIDTGTVGALAFSPDSRLLATADTELRIRIWDIASGNVVTTLTGHTRPILALQFSPDGRWLGSGGWDGQIHLWDPVSGKSQRSMESRGGIVTLDFSPTGEVLVSGNDRSSVEVWDTTLGVRRHAWAMHRGVGKVMDVSFSPEGFHVAAVGENGTAFLLRLADRDETGQRTLVNAASEAGVDDALRRRLLAAKGMINTHFGLCQTLPLTDLKSTLSACMREGYRPVRIRPYTREGEVFVAAAWWHDDLPAQVRLALTRDEANAQCEQLAASGYCLVDAAGYVNAAGESKYIVVAARDGRDPTRLACDVGASAAAVETAWQQFRKRGEIPVTSQIFHDAEGVLHRTLIRSQSRVESATSHGPRNSLDAVISRTRRLYDIDVTPSTLDGKPMLRYAFGYFHNVDGVSIPRYGQDPTASLVEFQNLAARGYRPIALSVGEDPARGELVCASIWGIVCPE